MSLALFASAVVLLIVSHSNADRLCPARSPLEGDRITYRLNRAERSLDMEKRTDHFLYDPKLKKFSLKQDWSPKTGEYTVWLLYDFDEQTTYSIHDHQCSKSHLEGPFDVFCLPDGFNASIPPKTWLGGGLDDPNLFVAEVVYRGSYSFVHTAFTYDGTPVMVHKLQHDDGWCSNESKIEIKKTTDHFLYDPKQQKFSLKLGWSEHTGDYAEWLLYDYPGQTLYIITMLHCAKAYLNASSFDVFCLPEKYDIEFGKTWFGDGEIVLYTAEFLFNESNFTVHSLLFAMYDDPMMDHKFGVQNGRDTLELLMYQNVKEVDPQPSDFNPPSYC